MILNFKFYKSVNQVIKDAGMNDGMLLFAANEAKKLMYDYVPMRTGALANTARVSIENGKGVVCYVQSYARFCYYGESRRFSRDMHEKASAYWDKAMLSSSKGVLTERIIGYINGGNIGRK